MKTNDSPSTTPSRSMWWPLGLILLVGCWFRLAYLGESALRADTINFWNICRQNLSGGEIYARWMELMGNSGHFPFPNAFVKWFLDTFQLPLTHTTVRLPSALWGILTVPAAYGLGRSLCDRRLGWLLAAMMALNPYHIQMTREVYFYPPLVLGATLCLWMMAWLWNQARGVEAVSRWFYAGTAVGFFFASYSQPSGWALVLLSLPLPLGVLIVHFRREKALHRPALIMLGIILLVALPAVTAPWGVRQLAQSVSAEHLQQYTRDTVVARTPVLPVLTQVVTAFGWGATPLRAGWTALVLLSGVVAMVQGLRKNRVLLLLPYILGTVLMLNIWMQLKANLVFDTRYFIVLLPAYLAVLGLGLEWVAALPVWERLLGPARKQYGTYAVTGLGLLLFLYPAHLSTRLAGKPTPYKKILAAVNTRLPRGTPVLVDRWLEPGNELRIYNSTNVIFTFTVPNEPLDVYLKQQWRSTVTNFFGRFPEGAYLEVNQPYSLVPEVGPWSWPAEHFAARERIVNEAGVALRELGLASRKGFYAPNTNRLVVTLYYNSRDELIQRARATGQSSLLLCDNEWAYTKTRDFSDWRVLEKAAGVDLYNFTTSNLNAVVELAGVAVNGSKSLVFGGPEPLVFEEGQSARVRIGPMTLQPGLSRLRLQDPAWPGMKAPLLVNDVRLVEP